MRDMTNNIQVKRVISPTRVTDNTAQVGQVIDRQGYRAVMYTINIGTLADADATFTVLLEEADASGGAYTAVADADMISQTSGTAPETAASFQFDDDNEVRKLGYIGNKRFTRLTITPANNSGNADISAAALLLEPANAPVSQATS